MARPVYRDSSQPIEKRIEDLLRRMTLEEKVGQMNMPCGWVGKLGKTIPEKTETVLRWTAGTQVKGMGPGGGFYASTGGQWIYVVSPQTQVAVRRNIKICRQNPGFYEVLEGLEPGETVITSGYDVFGERDPVVLKNVPR